MPQVPYNPVPEVSPSTQGTPYLTDRGATADAFGAGVGQAMGRFAQQLGQTADVIERNVLDAQQLKNEAEVNAATTEAIKQSADLTNKFRQLPGSQPQEQLNDHIKSLETARTTIKSTLTNKRAEKMFDQQTMHRFALDAANSSIYAATQMKAYTKQTYVDRGDAILQETVRDVNDKVPGAMERGVGRLIENERAAGKLDGENPDAVNKRIRTAITNAVAHTSSAVSQTDPKRAQSILDAAKKTKAVDETRIPEMQVRIDNNAIQVYATTDATAITDTLNTDPNKFIKNPEGTLAAMDTEANKKADERYPNDPLKHDKYLQQLRNNIAGIANGVDKREKGITQELKTAIGTVADTDLRTGRKPISIAEMAVVEPRIYDWVRQAEERDPGFSNALQTRFRTNNSPDNIVPAEELQDRKRSWAGKTLQEKMQVIPGDEFEKGRIDKATRDAWYAEQDRAKAAAMQNANSADRILSANRAILNKAGAFPSRDDAGANEKYIWIRGAIIEQLNKRAADGAPVKGPNEENLILNSILQEGASGSRPWWKFGFGTETQKPKYEIMSADQPEFVKKNYPDALKDPATGKWQVRRNGVLNNINIPAGQ